MTNQEILTKATTKAIHGGWSYHKATVDKDLCCWLYEVPGSGVTKYPNEFIFNHDFAKALWGEDKHKNTNLAVVPFKNDTAQHVVRAKDGFGLDGNYDYHELPNYQYHLQQMVIAEDPVKYLGDNI